MTLPKTKTTTRKFYGKWLYKVSLHLEGCSLYRMRSITEIKVILSQEAPPGRWGTYTAAWRAWNNRALLEPFFTLLEQYSKDTFNIRIEGANLDLYTNDSAIYEKFSNEFSGQVIHRFAPEETSLDLLNENSNYIVVKKLPKDRYRYRVYLKPHKMANDIEGKTNFIKWIKAQDGRITCSETLESWFIATNWNWDRRYVLVEDESTLLMLKLRSSDAVGRIYNFVVSDK